MLTSGFHDLSTFHAKLPYEQEKRFLSAVDLTKGPNFLSITNIVPKRDRKEVMYYTTEWEAKEWLGNTLRTYS